MPLVASFASLDDRAFSQIQFPQDVLHGGTRFQVQGRVMLLDGFGSFGINVGCHNDCSHWVLVG